MKPYRVQIEGMRGSGVTFFADEDTWGDDAKAAAHLRGVVGFEMSRLPDSAKISVRNKAGVEVHTTTVGGAK